MKIVSSGFIVKSRRGEILLGQVANHPSPYHYTVFKGQQVEGETLIDTALRELQEETGIDISGDDRLNKNISSNFVYQYHIKGKDVYLFLVEDVEGVLDNFEFYCSSVWGENGELEISDYKWVKIKDLKDYVFPSQRGLATYLQNNYGERK